MGVFAFDLMHLNGESLLKRPFRERRRLMAAHLPTYTPESVKYARWDHVKSLESNDKLEVETFFQAAAKQRCEGLMIKVRCLSLGENGFLIQSSFLTRPL